MCLYSGSSILHQSVKRALTDATKKCITVVQARGEKACITLCKSVGNKNLKSNI